MLISPTTELTDDQLQALYFQSAAEPYHGVVRRSQSSTYLAQRVNTGARLLLHMKSYSSREYWRIWTSSSMIQSCSTTITEAVFIFLRTQNFTIKENTLRCTTTFSASVSSPVKSNFSMSLRIGNKPTSSPSPLVSTSCGNSRVRLACGTSMCRTWGGEKSQMTMNMVHIPHERVYVLDYAFSISLLQPYHLSHQRCFVKGILPLTHPWQFLSNLVGICVISHMLKDSDIYALSDGGYHKKIANRQNMHNTQNTQVLLWEQRFTIQRRVQKTITNLFEA